MAASWRIRIRRSRGRKDARAVELVDDFDEQVKNYISGKTPFLRGTVGMIALAAEALTNLDRGLEPVVIVQLPWSTGADGFVAKDIKSLAELKGKTIVLQQNGPHVDSCKCYSRTRDSSPAR